MNKDEAFRSLVNQVAQWREAGERVVLCHGCFDPLHAGHLLHFQAARKFGSRLVVTVTADDFINKGPTRPFFSEALRLELVLAVRFVDAAAINLWDSAVPAIRSIRPDYFAKGSEYRDNPLHNPNFVLERKEIEMQGGEIIYTDEQTFSSTNLIKCVTTR